MRCCCFCFVSLLISVPAFGQPKMPNARIVFLTPADVDPPAGVTRRLTQVANYTEAMLVKWMKFWKYPPKRRQIFQRDSDGSVKVLFVKSPDTLASGQFPTTEGNLARKGRQLAMKKYRLSRTQDVWWVWVYIGDPLKKYRGFRGSGNAAFGGLSHVNYVNLPGAISPKSDIAAPFPAKLILKGTIHEFGHALGLPHNGPLEKLDLGIPLMGATIRNYQRRTKKRETRSYLTEASAAILWKHPLFTGTPRRRYAMPQIKWHDIRVENDAKERVVRLSGRVTSNIPVHSVVVFDTVPKIQQTYFQKTYVSRVKQDGSFEVTISEPIGVRTTGTLKLLACCDNGSVTGNSRKRGFSSAYDLKYRTTRGGLQLVKSHSTGPAVSQARNPTSRAGSR